MKIALWWCRWVPTLMASSLLAAAGGAVAASPAESAPAVRPAAERAGVQWLVRAHEASRRKTYAGTFVVLSASGATASSRIWHAGDGDQQVERMDALSGTPRTTFRHNAQVVTFLPESRIAKTEQRDAAGLFPHLMRVGPASVTQFYGVRHAGAERVAGFDTDVLQLQPKDTLRYGYRLWAEKKSGFAVQLQTLDGDGRILEQAAFSDLDLDAPVRADRLLQMMADTTGYRIEKAERTAASAAEEGWALKAPVAGFQPMDCFRRVPASSMPGSMQWIFSDGLATVSLFIEPYGTRPRQEWQNAMGVTQMLGRRVGADWWLVAIGEVPAQTLKAFAAALERRR